MANIYDLANELSRTLRDLPEYKAVVKVSKRLKQIQKRKSCLTNTSLSKINYKA